MGFTAEGRAKAAATRAAKKETERIAALNPQPVKSGTSSANMNLEPIEIKNIINTSNQNVHTSQSIQSIVDYSYESRSVWLQGLIAAVSVSEVKHASQIDSKCTAIADKILAEYTAKFISK